MRHRWGVLGAAVATALVAGWLFVSPALGSGCSAAGADGGDPRTECSPAAPRAPSDGVHRAALTEDDHEPGGAVPGAEPGARTAASGPARPRGRPEPGESHDHCHAGRRGAGRSVLQSV